MLICDRHINPDDYIEPAEKCFPVLSGDGSLLPTSPLQLCSEFSIEGTQTMVRPITAASKHTKELEEAGFIKCVETWDK